MPEDLFVLGTPRRRKRRSIGDRLRTLAKVLIAGITLVGLVDFGAAHFYATPFLIPALWWAARSSKAWGAAGFTLLAALLMAELGALLAYNGTGEAQPWILVWPCVGFVATLVLFPLTRSFARRSVDRRR